MVYIQKLRVLGEKVDYVVEALTCLLVPAKNLVKIGNIKTPMMDLCIELANYVNCKLYQQ